MHEAETDRALIAPVSYAQQRLWFFDRLQPGSPIYNVEHMETLSGPLDLPALRGAIVEIVRRHEALRTTFESRGGDPVQVIARDAVVALTQVDMIGRPDEPVRRRIAEELRRGFDLDRGPLVRFTLIEVDLHRQLLLLVAHHIVFDLWSVGVFQRELGALYESFKAGRPSPLAELGTHYSTYVAAQRPRYRQGASNPQLDYWRRQLADLPASSEFPTDRPRPAVQTYAGAVRTFTIAPEIAQPFRELTRGANTTLFMSLFAAFAVLMHRYAGQTDVAIGTPIANRGKPGLGDMIGLLLNMIVLRLDLSDDPSVETLLARTREVALAAFDNQDVPFELLVEDLRPDRDPSRNPMFQTMFVYQPGQVDQAGSDDGADASNGAKFDITLTVKDAAPALRFAVEYNTDLFDPATIERLAGHYTNLIAAMAANPDRPVSALGLLGPVERRRILYEWNATRAPLPPQACLHHLFEDVVAATPDAVAVSLGGAALSYRELDRRAEDLAATLRRLGVRPDVRVGICMERSLDWTVAIVATLKSGGAMVPLDGSFPPSRLEFMIGDAGIAVILSQTQLAAKVSGGAAPVICLDQPLSADTPAPIEGGVPMTGRNLAYVVYTSGSTGKPKGVLVQHDGAVNFTAAQTKAWSIGPGARVLQFTAFGFDIGLSEIFLTLCSGAEFCLAAPDALIPGPPLLRTLRDLRITHVTLPPSALAAMQPEALPDLKLLISAGEPCEPGLARRWAQRPIVNAYGPTEATIYATVGAFTPPNLFPVGRPIPNNEVYVLDRHGEPVPPGVTGEIHIGGVGVARGYLNRPDLTAERFVADPFTDRPGARLYKTGDYGRFDAEGTLHHLGRIDGQLKIRGYRIEPGEVESVLRLHPQVNDALVMGHGSGPDARLIAYVLPADPPPLVVELRGFLARQLPDYMSPAAYMMVEAWPKTANGKIDRAALPRPDLLARGLETTFVAPVNDIEQSITAIWRDVLGVEQVGVTDNFFDLGGHSLLLVRVHDQMKEKLKIELSLIDLFRFPTVKRQAEMLEVKPSSRMETESLGRTDQRAARQHAARMNRRPRTGAERYA